MSVSKDRNLKLKLGNLFLASLFSIVPTAMTIAFLGVHGFLLCKDLESRLESTQKIGVIDLCNKSNIESNTDYILWVWLFTMVPTWRWFYIGHYRRVKNNNLK